ncbi:MAG: hypothetical protein A2X11_12700 [Bacteroidetes bacterium GWE2_42_24]|nr:MAG: hypothetical protein A2X11_12700 [Bacteroidetes bacterium GWE2_42_24]OFY30635.1 MAG: hypothetical protein A2X09_03950 [Bacteroidetes bacterium GWF2_43_11]
MTPKQIERIQTKIKMIRSVLTEEKRIYGGYHDGRGLRYAMPELYLSIQDFKGRLNYTGWFDKNFPDDIRNPIFLFKRTFILFKNNKLKEPESKALKTYFSNSYLFGKFFDRPIIPIDKYEVSNFDLPEFTACLTFLKNQTVFTDFTGWLEEFEKTKRFKLISSHF